MDKSAPDPAKRAGPFMKLPIRITGVDEATLQLCPQRDWDIVRALGELMSFTWLYQAGLFYLTGQHLFGSPGQIRLDFVLISIFIATFILLIDSYMVMRSGWHLNGIQELKRAGLDISGGAAVRVKVGLFLAIRIGLSVALAQITAIIVALLFYGTDINARVHDRYLKANAVLIAETTALFDGEIQRGTEAVTAQNSRVAALSGQVRALRQNLIAPDANDKEIEAAQQEVLRLLERKTKADDDVRGAETFAANEFGGIKGAAGNSGQPGRGLRYRAAAEQVANAKARAETIERELQAARARLDALRSRASSSNQSVIERSRDQLPRFEQELAAENATLTRLNDKLAQRIAERENAIRDALEKAPSHVVLEAGFLGQVLALESIVQENFWTKFFVLLIDFVAFGFELAGVLAKITSFVPTTYATLLARDAYVGAIKIVDETIAELNAVEDKKPNPPAGRPCDEPSGGQPTRVPDPSGGLNGSSVPPKRGRGRPRKHPKPD